MNILQLNHNLEIELDRYKNIPRNQRHCKFGKILDDEFHFFFDCKVTDNIRPSFIDFMKTKYPGSLSSTRFS
jgi:hypothetical protein